MRSAAVVTTATAALATITTAATTATTAASSALATTAVAAPAAAATTIGAVVGAVAAPTPAACHGDHSDQDRVARAFVVAAIRLTPARAADRALFPTPRRREPLPCGHSHQRQAARP